MYLNDTSTLQNKLALITIEEGTSENIEENQVSV